ncbi:MAG: hypothetical protein CVT49_07240 [candidate division Zixibacteria bacterium HGW-Zixibacteria-1]|nr:MAG: hypothetical protein CVT49_07240 [candidate division Zixibacteria bacterium HGW-Zixibacteria-1]
MIILPHQLRLWIVRISQQGLPLFMAQGHNAQCLTVKSICLLWWRKVLVLPVNIPKKAIFTRTNSTMTAKILDKIKHFIYFSDGILFA